MTKDRAIEVLYVYASVNGSGRCTQDEFEEAKKMAIEALESQDRQAIIAGSYLLEGEDNVPDTNVGDIISRQAAIDALRGMQTYKLFAGDDQLLIDQAGAQTELMMLPHAQPEQRWIPCSERLPDETNSYIVTEYSGVVEACAFYDTESSREYWRRFVIAWMPLPEPYKGEEE